MNKSRLIASWALSPEHLNGRMSFIAGPRQIGKTTLIENFLKQKNIQGHYYNWDSPLVKKRYAKDPSFFVEDLSIKEHEWVALDEIHKHPKWKNILKGYYDEWKKRVQFVITGSARLDLFRKSGDSLVGRYFLFRLFPLGPREILGQAIEIEKEWHPLEKNLLSRLENQAGIYEVVQQLLACSGFPEPFFKGQAKFYNLWKENHISMILQEDLRDLSKITSIRKIEQLLYLLEERVTSPLSLNSIRQLLECAHDTLNHWLLALEKVYLTFSIPPWSERLSRSILKEKKVYFWDWSFNENAGSKFENFIAVSLMRTISAWNEQGLGPYFLYYVRTKDGHEVDFAIADRKKVHLLIEAKNSDSALDTNLLYLQEKLKVETALQVVNQKGIFQQKKPNVFIVGVDRLMGMLL